DAISVGKIDFGPLKQIFYGEFDAKRNIFNYQFIQKNANHVQLIESIYIANFNVAFIVIPQAGNPYSPYAQSPVTFKTSSSPD
ncbi:MAG: hypothetical protein EZS28_018682, partial [Streblomastix strix]